MELARIRVQGVWATPACLRDIPRGITGATVRFEYVDPVWDGLSKTVVFRGCVTRDVVNAGEVVTIPAEVVSRAGGSLQVGVYGTDVDHNLIIPTLWADLGKIRSAADPSGDETADVSLPVWGQISERVESLRKEIESGKVIAEVTTQDGPAPGDGGGATHTLTITYVDGTKTVIGWRDGYNGKDGEVGPAGPAYELTSQDKQTLVNAVLSSEEIAKMRQTIEDMEADLNYVKIDITGISNNVGTVEKGLVVDSVTITWTVNKTPKSQTVNGEAVDVSLRSKTLSGLGLKEDRTFTVKVTDERNASDSASTSVTFLNGVYYGAAAIPATLDSAFVLGLRAPVLTSTRVRTITVTATNSQYIWYALPVRLGKCTFTVDGFAGGFTLVDTIAFTNQHGYEEPYYIYRSDNIVPGETKAVIT